MKALAYVSCILVTFHILHNKLFYNCRFKIKTKCYTLGRCWFDLFNTVICNKCLQTVCADNPKLQCNRMLKWVVNIIVCGYTIVLCSILRTKKYNFYHAKMGALGFDKATIDQELEDDAPAGPMLDLLLALYLF